MIVVTKEELELYHSGIKGMKWGIRRYQNPDGSLTPAGRQRYLKNPRWRKKYLAYKAKEALEKKRAAETKEERHKRLLESTDANELYKYKNELTTGELKERIERIRTEQDLARYVTKEPTRMEKAKAVFDKVADAGDKAVKFANTPAGKEMIKTLKRQMGISDSAKTVNYDRELKRLAEMTNEEVQSLTQRARNEQNLRRIIDELNGNSRNEPVVDDRTVTQAILDAYENDRININDWEAQEAIRRFVNANS